MVGLTRKILCLSLLHFSVYGMSSFYNQFPQLLCSAAASGNIQRIQEIASAGGNINVKDSASQASPLIFAVMCEQLASVALLLSLGADSNLEDKYGNTPLMHAVIKRNKHIIQKLLEAGADPRAQNIVGESALSYAEHDSALADIYTLLSGNQASNNGHILRSFTLKEYAEKPS